MSLLRRFLLSLSVVAIVTSALVISAAGHSRALAETGIAMATPSATLHFAGTLPSNRPAVRVIHLTAGDAVKLWVLPGAAKSSVQQGDLALGIALPRPQFARWVPYASGDKDCVPSYWGNKVTPGFGQQSDFFSDYADPYKNDPVSRHAMAAVGVILAYTGWNDPLHGECRYSTGEAPYFFISARSDKTSDGLWAVYVAPSTANYSFALTGSGDYKMTLSSQRFDKSVAPTGSSGGFDQGAAKHDKIFPFTGAAWDKVIRTHQAWFLRSGFFPVHRFSLGGHSEDVLPALRTFFR